MIRSVFEPILLLDAAPKRIPILQTIENNLKHDESDVSDALSKLKVFEDENLDLTNSLPTILHQIETNLKDVTSTSYTISADNR